MEELKIWMEDLLTKNNQELIAKLGKLEARMRLMESKLSKCTCQPFFVHDGDESTSFDWKMVNVNPFLIPLVVQNLMKFIEPRHLPSSRYVCKLWASVAMPQLVEKNTILINYNNFSKISEFRAMVATTFCGFSRFHVDFEPSLTKTVPSGHIFHLYEILPLFIGNLLYLKIGITHDFIVHDFWDRFLCKLNRIETLVISSISRKFLDVSTIFPAGPNMKILGNLTTLVIEHGYTGGRWRQSGFITGLLRMAPNLRNLKIQGENEADYGTRMSLSSCVTSALCEVKPEHLENINLCTSLTENGARNLLQSNLRLRKLSLLNYRLFKLEFSARDLPIIEPLAMSYAEIRAEVISERLGRVLEEDFKISKSSKKEASCIQLLHTFQSTLDCLVLPGNHLWNL